MGVAVVVPLVVLTAVSAVYNRLTDTPSAVPPLDAHGHRVRTGDLTTHYEKWGTAGSVVVLVPGFAESACVFTRLGPVLAASGHRVYAIDVRGYGYTERRGSYTLTADTSQLADFLEALGLRRSDGTHTVLVGHSSGAAIVGDLALTRPSEVSGIVFLDGDGTPYGVGPSWIHRLVRDTLATSVVRPAESTSRVCGGLLDRRVRARLSAVHRCAAAAWTRPFRVAGGSAAMREILGRQLIGLRPREITRIRVPAAVVYGGRDPENPPSPARETARRLHAGLPIAVPGPGTSSW